MTARTRVDYQGMTFRELVRIIHMQNSEIAHLNELLLGDGEDE